MHPAPIVIATEHGKKFIGAPCLVIFAYWRRGTWVRQYIGALIHPAPIVLAHQKRNALQVHRVNRVLGFLSSHSGTLGIYHVTSFTLPIGAPNKKNLKRGGPNISMHLAYFHPNRLLTGLYKQEMEIL
jgi:hypothetical protein